MIDLHGECARIDAECDKKQETVRRHQGIFDFANALEVVLNNFGYRDVDVRWSDALEGVMVEVMPHEKRGYKELAWLHENIQHAGFVATSNYESGKDRMYAYVKAGSPPDCVTLRVNVRGSEVCRMIEVGTVSIPKYKTICEEE